jgi:hypothetical protein
VRAAFLPGEPLARRPPGEQVEPRAAEPSTIPKLLRADLAGVGDKRPVAQVVLVGAHGLGVEVEGGAKLEA